MTKLQSAALFFILGFISAVFYNLLFKLSLSLGLSWVISYILPWFLVCVFSFFMSKSIGKMLNAHYRFWVPVLTFLVLPGIHFAFNPVYQGDFNRSGEIVEMGNNRIVEDILNYSPDFEGFVCVASPSCPYCIEAVQTKVNFLFERQKVQTLVYLGYGDENIIGQFRVNSSSQKIPIIINSEPSAGLDIEENVIPVFLYIKNKKIVHIWRNQQLGFPALDWVENKLN